jgi:hypothetical protein
MLCKEGKGQGSTVSLAMHGGCNRKEQSKGHAVVLQGDRRVWQGVGRRQAAGRPPGASVSSPWGLWCKGEKPHWCANLNSFQLHAGNL